MGVSVNEHFEQGLSEAIKAAQLQANKEGRPIRVQQNMWVNPSSASLARRNRPEYGHDQVISSRITVWKKHAK